MPQDLTFIHLTDPHIVAAPPTEEGGEEAGHLHSDTDRTFALVRGLLADLDPAPDFVVISGDLTNKGTPENFETFRRHLDGLPAPVVLALGNHDTRGAFHDVVLGEPERGDAPYDHALVIAGLHIVVLDSSTPGSPIGGLDEAQFVWLDRELAAHPDLPKLVVVHHPPAPVPLPVFDFLNFEPADAARLRDALADRNVIGVLSGHVHFDQFTTWRGVPYVVSAGLHTVTDVLATDALRAVRGGSFNVCRVRDGRLTVMAVPLPGDRAELYRYGLDAMRRHLAPAEPAPTPADD